MAHHRFRVFFSLAAVITIASTAFFAVAASGARAVSAFIGKALAYFDPAPQTFLDRPATTTVRVLGLHETRSFASRLMARSEAPAFGRMQVSPG